MSSSHDAGATDWKTFWNDYYSENESPWLDPDEWLVAEAAEVEPGTAVDLGAGEGGNSLWLAERGWQVTAVDFAPSGLEALETEAEGRGVAIETSVADVTTFDAGRPFDLVLLAFMHLEKDDRETMLANAVRLVAPGGILLYVGLTNMEYQAPPGLEHIFARPEMITPSLQDLEIELSEVRRRKIPYPTDDPDEMADGVLIRARRPRG